MSGKRNVSVCGGHELANALYTTPPCNNYSISWTGLADCMGATSYALGSGGFILGFEMCTSTKVFVPGVSFWGTWEIGTSSTIVWEFRFATSLASVGELGVRASIVDVDALGGSASLEDSWKIWSEMGDIPRDIHTFIYRLQMQILKYCVM